MQELPSDNTTCCTPQMRRLAKSRHTIRARVMASQLATAGGEKLMLLYKSRSLWVRILGPRATDSPRVRVTHVRHCWCVTPPVCTKTCLNYASIQYVLLHFRRAWYESTANMGSYEPEDDGLSNESGYMWDNPRHRSL